MYIEYVHDYTYTYIPQSQQLPLRIARSVSDTILSHALGLDLKELGKVLLAAPKSRHDVQHSSTRFQFGH